MNEMIFVNGRERFQPFHLIKLDFKINSEL